MVMDTLGRRRRKEQFGAELALLGVICLFYTTYNAISERIRYPLTRSEKKVCYETVNKIIGGSQLTNPRVDRETCHSVHALMAVEKKLEDEKLRPSELKELNQKHSELEAKVKSGLWRYDKKERDEISSKYKAVMRKIADKNNIANSRKTPKGIQMRNK